MFFRTRVPAKIVDMAYEALMEFARSGIPIFIVPGNHESSRLPPSLWLGASNIYVFDRPRTFEITVSGYQVAMSGFPFARNDAGHRFKSLLAATGWQGTSAAIRLLCMHQAVEGAQFGPTNFTFRAGRDVVRMSDIPEEFAAVLTGHIHRRQVLNRPRGRGNLPVVYPGSIERTSFAEKDEPKGFFEIGLAPDEAGTWWTDQMRFIEVPARPMAEILIDPKTDSTSLRHYLTGRIAGLDKDSIVKLKLTSDVDGASRATLTMPFFRSIFPGSMDIQMGMEFYRDVLRAPNHARE